MVGDVELFSRKIETPRKDIQGWKFTWVLNDVFLLCYKSFYMDFFLFNIFCSIIA